MRKHCKKLRACKKCKLTRFRQYWHIELPQSEPVMVISGVIPIDILVEEEIEVCEAIKKWWEKADIIRQERRINWFKKGNRKGKIRQGEWETYLSHPDMNKLQTEKCLSSTTGCQSFRRYIFRVGNSIVSSRGHTMFMSRRFSLKWAGFSIHFRDIIIPVTVIEVMIEYEYHVLRIWKRKWRNTTAPNSEQPRHK